MKKINSLIGATALTAMVLTAVPFSTSAIDGDVVYGTMDIPYAEFYKAELENSSNPYDVDAVSSATANKWAGNNTGSFDEEGNWQNGGLVAGTYNQPNEDGQGGTILGVTYPIAISETDLEALGENNYNFQKFDEQAEPTAYKEVTVTDGTATFSKIVDTNGENTVEGAVTVATQSNYGDYQFTVTGYPEQCDYYGVIFNTEEGNSYAMRHLENIWRNGSFSWSVGYKTTESHGNTLSYENFVSSIGQHINSVTYITLDGYTTVNVEPAYLPVKLNSTVEVENGNSGKGNTTYTLTDFPEDFDITPSVGDGFSAEDGTISYENAQPGSYTLNVADNSGKYENKTGNFLLSTDDVPVRYEDGKLVPADGFTDEDVANFVKNITSVSVNGTVYNTGRRGVTVITSEGAVDFEVKSGEENVFDGSGNYELVITSTGYNTPATVNITADEPAVTTTTTESTTTTTNVATTTVAGTTTKAAATTKTVTTTAKVATTAAAAATTKAAATTTAASSGNNSPQTGVANAAIPASILALATATATVFRKKND